MRGEVRATRVFATRGVVVAAALDGTTLRWLVHEGGRYQREDGSVALEGRLDPALVFALQGSVTVVGRGSQAFALAPGAAPERFALDAFRGRPGVVHAGERRASGTFAQGGRLLRRRSRRRQGRLGRRWRWSRSARPERVGDVLAGQDAPLGGRIASGFGFYRAGTVAVAFVFDAERAGPQGHR